MRNELIALRSRMAEENIDAYLIPTDDFHGSEYVGDYFKCRAYVSGFTGSAGTLIVTKDWAGLWTDGRYFIQAAQQLAGSGIELCKSGEKGVPTEEKFLLNHLDKGQCLAFDGRTVTTKRFQALKKTLSEKDICLRTDIDLAGDIWTDRPSMSAEPIWELSVEYSGKSRAEKLADIRKTMSQKGADIFLLSSLDDIAWLLNIRGNDIACCPFVLSYLAVEADCVRLFINPSVCSDDLRKTLETDGVVFAPYFDVYTYAAAVDSECSVLLDEEKTNCTLYQALDHGCKLICSANPTALAKAVKNATEVANMRTAHIRDGVALTKFMFWLKQNAGKVPMSELSVTEVLEELRRQQPNYIGPSFEPILAHSQHGAICHYSATEESNLPVSMDDFLLCDTGGHYLEGTTDVTRTFAMGTVSDEMRTHYTAVLRSHLALLNAKFLHGCRGSALDMIARQPMWSMGLDYNHGTGHGVGYLLSVHEGPCSFRFRSAGQDAVLEAGMIISNEPGLYLADRYGIRLENLVVVEELFENEYGKFMGLSALTLAPFDLDAIDAEQLSKTEKEWLNRYHSEVYEKLSPYMSEEENAWLVKATAAV